MYQEERMDAVLQHLKQYQRMSIQEMCTLFGVSRDTARRDVIKLTEQQSVVRTHGGVMLPNVRETLKGYKERLEKAAPEKRLIAEKAVEKINEGEAIMLDASTTVQFAAEQINSSPLTVITNSIVNAESINDSIELDIYLLGGRLNTEHRFLYGPSTLAKLDQFYADKAFVGVIGICEDGFYYAHEEDAAVKKRMVERADKVYVLADHSKFFKKHFYKGMELHGADVIITDALPSKEMRDILEDNGIELIIGE
ncbi:DeoR/GlpR family transcriptional regulator of sugar metabolism [Salibacterium salarium]|uniref:DeoR/GlpR family DNA-binding transcription regulator n=1 Tax=Salibacterium salarium TaxID=284579 RepID=UPI002785B6D8|nr:DeoR/GlpR family DNA-binding transcription regulator [Salibacterium salarium]MDQ0300821.1 DeoR/GlpR family transcriptional regulator of sugar metabolism [Salibacterium salarium]